MFGGSFWPRQVGRTATKLSYVTQNLLHCPFHFIASRRHFECYFLRARITYHQESAGKIPTEWGMGSSFTGLTHFVSRKKQRSPPKPISAADIHFWIHFSRDLIGPDQTKTKQGWPRETGTNQIATRKFLLKYKT